MILTREENQRGVRDLKVPADSASRRSRERRAKSRGSRLRELRRLGSRRRWWLGLLQEMASNRLSCSCKLLAFSFFDFVDFFKPKPFERNRRYIGCRCCLCVCVGVKWGERETNEREHDREFRFWAWGFKVIILMCIIWPGCLWAGFGRSILFTWA